MTSPRIQRACGDTMPHLLPRAALPPTIIGLFLSIIVLMLLGYRQAVVEQVIAILVGGVLVGYVIWPSCIFAWNYLRTPWRLAKDEVLVLFQHGTDAYEAAEQLMEIMLSDLRSMRAQDAMLYVAKSVIAELVNGTIRPVLRRTHAAARDVLRSREGLLISRDLRRRQRALSEFRSSYEAFKNLIEPVGRVIGPGGPADPAARPQLNTAYSNWRRNDSRFQDFVLGHQLNAAISGERLE